MENVRTKSALTVHSLAFIDLSALLGPELSCDGERHSTSSSSVLKHTGERGREGRLTLQLGSHEEHATIANFFAVVDPQDLRKKKKKEKR